MANVIHVIMPYRHASTWVFDDPRVGLSQEPFMSGIPEMIDTMVESIPNAEKRGFGFCLPQSRSLAIKSSWRRSGKNTRACGISGPTMRRAGSVRHSFCIFHKPPVISTSRQRPSKYFHRIQRSWRKEAERFHVNSDISGLSSSNVLARLGLGVGGVGW